MTQRAGPLFAFAFAFELIGGLSLSTVAAPPECDIFHIWTQQMRPANPGGALLRKPGVAHCHNNEPQGSMPALNDLALTVEEPEPGQFFWTLLEAHHADEASETLDYRVYRKAARPQASYSNAMAMGVLELQKISAAANPAGETG